MGGLIKGITGDVGSLVKDIGGAVKKIPLVGGAVGGLVNDVGNIVHGAGQDIGSLLGAHGAPSNSLSQSQQLALQQAQSLLAEYNSGTLNPADAAQVQQAQANMTAVDLQNFSNAGLLRSSAAVNELGTQFQQTPYGQIATAGASSQSPNAQAAALTQQMLGEDLNNAMAYLGVAAGQANALSALSTEAQQQVTQDIGQASQSLGSVIGGFTSKQGAGSTGGVDPDAYIYGNPPQNEEYQLLFGNPLSSQGTP